MLTNSIGKIADEAGQDKKYAADISDKMWGVTGDTIKFGSDGLLKYGQNRLSACVRGSKPFTSHTVFGIDPALFARMDTAVTGRPRRVPHR